MQDFQQRVVDEKTELDDKTSKLGAFTQGPLFASLPNEEQARLIRQYTLMGGYSEVLGERIAAFK